MSLLLEQSILRITQGWTPLPGNKLTLSFMGRLLECVIGDVSSEAYGTLPAPIGNNTVIVLHSDLDGQASLSRNSRLVDLIKAATTHVDEAATAAAIRALDAGSRSLGISLSDVGGYDDQLQALLDLVVTPLTEPSLFASLQLDPPRGVLLHGPPGMRAFARVDGLLLSDSEG